MVEHGPRAAVTQLDRGEVYYVEVDVVLAHELIQVDVLVVEPPPLPFGGVISRDTRITNACVKLRWVSVSSGGPSSEYGLPKRLQQEISEVRADCE